jgi:hypothetical protein
VAFVKVWNQIVVGLRKRRYAQIAQSICSLGKGIDSMLMIAPRPLLSLLIIIVSFDYY